MATMFTPTDLIGAKRDGAVMSDQQLKAFVQGLLMDAPHAWSDAQVGAMAMAMYLKGLSAPETAALTRHMAHSGITLDWGAQGSRPPIIDKHSSGGVGDKVSLILTPLLAACGLWVPMISGRGLGHTGGTLDKLESISGFKTDLNPTDFQRQVSALGCAIVGAGADMAPADRRLYGIRDVTGTVASLPLITASILSKKLAAGLDGLVMDVKVGNGAFMPSLPEAQALARSLVQVAHAAGLPTIARISDMNQLLGRTAGNALEVQEAMALLRGEPGDPRLLELVLTLAADALCMAGRSAFDARQEAQQALTSGAALDRWARMCHAQGARWDMGLALADQRLPRAPAQQAVLSDQAGWVHAIDVLALGQAIVRLGGGRQRPDDLIHPGVGLDGVCPIGARVEARQPLLFVHAQTPEAIARESPVLRAAFTLHDEPPPGMATLLIDTIAPDSSHAQAI